MSAEAYEAFKTAFYESASGQKAAIYAYDIASSWRVIAISAVVAIIIAYAYLFLIKAVGGIIIYVSIAIIILSLTLGGGYMFWKRDDYDPKDPTYDYITYAAYVVFGIDVLIILATLCCFHAIKIGIAVFKTTS